MRILLTLRSTYLPALGGANKIHRYVAETLARQGHVVQMVALGGSGGPQLPGSAASESTLAQELDARSIAWHREPDCTVFSLAGVEVHGVQEDARLLAVLAERIRAFDPEWILVSTEDWGYGVLETTLDEAPGRVVSMIYTPIALPFGPCAMKPDPDRSRLFQRVSGIVSICQFVHDYVKKWSGLESEIIYLPMYGDGPFPHLGRFDNPYVTLINPSAGKGIDILVALAERSPDVAFAAVPTWATGVADRQALDRLANVSLLEPQEDIDRILAQTRILLMPSLWPEGYPLIVVEALLRGIPVLASDAGGVPEAKLGTDFVLPVRPIEGFSEARDERLLPIPVTPEQRPEDIDRWHQALGSLLSDQEFYESQSTASRQAALDFVSGLSIRPLEEYLERLAAPASHPPVRPPDGASTIDRATGDNRREELSALTPEARALLLKWLEQDRAQNPRDEQKSAGANSTIRRIARDAPLPLSFAQERFWLLDQLQPGDPTYNIRMAYHIAGMLDVRGLEQSLNEVLRRHEVLRTTYAVADGKPVQVINPPPRLSLPVVNLEDVPAPGQREEMHRLIHEETLKSFDLRLGPMLRASLIRLGAAEHVLVLAMHHIAADGWSLRTLRAELAILYPAFVAGRASPLADLAIQYADYAQWQRQWLQGEVLATQLAYWKHRLEGMPAQLSLPVDRPRLPKRTQRGAGQSRVAPTELLLALKALGQSEHTTLFVILLAAFKALLYRYTGQADMVVGAPLANRSRAEIEGLIGYFANTAHLRTDLSGNPTFRELVKRVHETTGGALEHQDLPYQRLVTELGLPGERQGGSAFQVWFDVGHAAMGKDSMLPGLAVDWMTVESQTAQFDLSIAFREEPGSLHVSANYSTDLFDDATIGRLLGHYLTLLEGVTAHPNAHIADLPLLTAGERQQILVTWTDTVSDTPPAECFPDYFDSRAGPDPDVVAVEAAGLGESDNETLTYAELDAAANQIAHFLRSLGAGPETIVGVCLERSPLLIVALLGVLKAGCVFMPLDPGQPDERLRYFIEDTGTPIVLTQDSLKSRLPAAHARLIALDIQDQWRQCASGSLASGLVPQNAAYLIYTSGSTGQPKGVVVEHRGLVSYLAWRHQYDLFRLGERRLFLDAVGFDAMVGTILGALTAQATLVLPAADAYSDPSLLLDTIIRQRITNIECVPSLLRALVNQPQFDACSTLRLIVTGAETVPVDLKEEIMRRLPVRMTNGYGPTEATVSVLFHECVAGAWEPRMPIGFPTANTQIYILDAALQPVPIGIAGEIYIGGIQVARGYWNSPAITAAKFIPNPYGQPGARVYRTGDLGRWLPNGEVDFLGRNDHQVKVRGHRIELGEIEAALIAHVAVDEAVVLAPDDGAGSHRLVAYVKLRSGQHLTTSDLARSLRSKLPSYMVPSGFVFMDALPHTTTGKVDRKALPSFEWTRNSGDNHGDERPGRDPGSLTEMRLVAIWSEVLGVASIGVDDDFFDLGGHSLLAAQLVYRLRQEFRSDLPLRRLFDAPTVAGLAAYLDAPTAPAAPSPASLLPLQTQGRQPPFFFLPGGGGSEDEYLTAYANLIHRLGHEQPVYGFKARGLNGDRAPHASVTTMAADYVAELRGVQPHGPYFLGGECVGGKVALEMARCLRAEGEEVALLVLLNAVIMGTASHAAGLARTTDQPLPQSWRQVSGRLRELRSLPTGQRLPRVAEMARNAAIVTFPLTADQRRQRERRLVKLHYQRILQAFVPSLYDGDVTLLMTSDLSSGRLVEGWRASVSGRLMVQPLDGVHRTYLGAHVEVNAAVLRACLIEAQAPAHR